MGVSIDFSNSVTIRASLIAMHDFLSHALVSDEAAQFPTSHVCHILPPLQGCSIKAFANTKFHFLVHASPKDQSNSSGIANNSTSIPQWIEWKIYR